MRIIGGSIDLNKIDKTKIIPGKDGAKYYNIDIIVNDEPNQYGKDVQIVEPQTKEQRQAKDKRTFLGSGKTVFIKEADGVRVSAPIEKGQSTNPSTASDDDLPF